MNKLLKDVILDTYDVKTLAEALVLLDEEIDHQAWRGLGRVQNVQNYQIAYIYLTLLKKQIEKEIEVENAG